MPKIAEKKMGDIHISLKLKEYIKNQPRVTVPLKEIQQSLSNIGISLSQRVIKERERTDC